MSATAEKLTKPQARVLRMLAASPTPLPCSTNTDDDLQVVSAAVAYGLKVRGLIRLTGWDGRRWQARITAKGKKALARVDV